MKSDKRKRAPRKVPPVVRPSSPREWALYRCKQSCQLGRKELTTCSEAFQSTALAFAVFNLLHAVEELANMIGPNTSREAL
jgi:hypothetical protein